MGMLERIEKRFLFPIMKITALLLLFGAAVLFVVSLYTFLASKSLETEPTKVEVTIEEIQSHMGEKQKIDLAQSNQVELSVTQEEEIETLMAAILKRILSIHKIGEESPQYTTNVNNILNWINDNIYYYDNAAKVDVLRAFERVSKSFEQQTFMESAELFFELYNSKYQDIEALKESKI